MQLNLPTIPLALPRPGARGTCWCCGAPHRQTITELCLECENVRIETIQALAQVAREQAQQERKGA